MIHYYKSWKILWKWPLNFFLPPVPMAFERFCQQAADSIPALSRGNLRKQGNIGLSNAKDQLSIPLLCPYEPGLK